jgi:hypothetical protein
MLLFRSEEHAKRWCTTWKHPFAGTLSIETGWKLAQAWHGPDRRDPAWRRKTLEETEALFADLGLTGPFWALRG